MDDELADRFVEQLIARVERAEAALAQCRHDLTEMIERKEYFRQVWEVAEAALAARDTPCVWVKRADGWPTPGCGLGPAVVTGGVFKLCPYCGHPFEVAP